MEKFRVVEYSETLNIKTMHTWLHTTPSKPKSIAEELLLIENAITFDTEIQIFNLLKNIKDWQDLNSKWATLKNRSYG